MKIWCCQCEADIEARLTNGFEVYPTRRDLWKLPFWKCDGCGNHVGCHHKHHEVAMRTRPLGTIPNAAMSVARRHIHARLDPLWKSGLIHRKALYGQLSGILGRKYHTAELRTVEEGRKVYAAIQMIERRFQQNRKGSA